MTQWLGSATNSSFSSYWGWDGIVLIIWTGLWNDLLTIMYRKNEFFMRKWTVSWGSQVYSYGLMNYLGQCDSRQFFICLDHRIMTKGCIFLDATAKGFLTCIVQHKSIIVPDFSVFRNIKRNPATSVMSYRSTCPFVCGQHAVTARYFVLRAIYSFSDHLMTNLWQSHVARAVWMPYDIKHLLKRIVTT